MGAVHSWFPGVIVPRRDRPLTTRRSCSPGRKVSPTGSRPISTFPLPCACSASREAGVATDTLAAPEPRVNARRMERDAQCIDYDQDERHGTGERSPEFSSFKQMFGMPSFGVPLAGLTTLEPGGGALAG